MGLFGKKKDKDASKGDGDSSKKATPTPEGFSPAVIPADPQQQPSGGGGGDGDMFGGMSVSGHKTKRKGGKKGAAAAAGSSADQISDTASDATGFSAAHHQTSPPSSHPPPHRAESQTGEDGDHDHSPAGSNAEKPTEQPKEQFFSKFAFEPEQEPYVPDEEDPASAKLRARLERFYEEYNPSKLSHIDQTMATYEGREEELFGALVKKYGPEPAVAVAATVNSADNNGNEHEEEGPGGSDQNGVGSGGGGFGFASADGGGFGSGGGGGGGWGSTENLSEHQQQGSTASGGGFGFVSGGGADDNNKDTAAASGGGFGFVDGASSGDGGGGGGGFGFATTTAADDSTPGGGGGFGFVADTAADTTSSSPPAATSGGGGFGFMASASPEHDATADEKGKPKFGGGGGGNDDSSSSSDDDDDLTMNERHRKELGEAKKWLQQGKTHLAASVAELAQLVTSRVDLVARHKALEAKLEDAISKELYDAAESLNAELDQTATYVRDKDAEELTLLGRIAEAEGDVRNLVQGLGKTYAAQQQELQQSKLQEERKVRTYIAETRSRLDQSGEKVKADLERATRLLHNTEQEVVNLEQRKEKIHERIDEQTKTLRVQRDEVAQRKDVLEADIKELEAKLAQKRRTLAETNVQLSTVTDKLQIITDDNAGTLNEVDAILSEEQTKHDQATATVSELSQQQEEVLKQESDLAREEEEMELMLQGNNKRTEVYGILAEELETAVAAEVGKFHSMGFSSIMSAREEKRDFLAPLPQQEGEEQDDNGGKSSSTTKTSVSLQRAEADLQGLQATEATLRLEEQNMRRNLPLLEAAKKAAAQAKQFKDAAGKTEEIKKLNEALANIDHQLKDLVSQIGGRKEEIKTLRVRAEAERKELMKSVESFTTRYSKLLRRTLTATYTGTTLQDRLDLEEVKVGVATSASDDDQAGGQPEQNGDDDVVYMPRVDDWAEALAALVKALQTELTYVAPSAMVDAADSYDTSDVSEAQPSSSSSSSEEAKQSGAPIQEDEEEEEEEVFDRAFAEAEVARLTELQEAAMEAEEYDECEALQTRIDAWQKKLDDN